MYPNTTARPFRDRRAVMRKGVAALGVSLLGIAAFATPAHAVGIGVNSGTLNADGVPTWYQDADGQQIKVCVAAAACGAVPAGEDLYWSATGTIGGTVLTLTQSATIDPIAGNTVIGRLRIRSTDLTPGQWYRFTTPYGQKDILAVSAARTINFSNDIGCGPLAVPPPGAVVGACTLAPDTFSNTTGSDLGPSFLQWDVAAGIPPAGFLGDGVSAHTVVGSTFFAPGETTAANYFRIDAITGNGGTVTARVGQADQFSAVVGALQSAPAGVLVNSSMDFGGHRINAGPVAKPVTLRNAGSGPLVINSIALGGANASQFILGAGGCGPGQQLASGASCAVNLSFSPTGTSGSRSAALNVTETAVTGGPSVARTFPILGAGTIPVVAAAPGVGIDFGNQAIGSIAGPRRVTIANTGTDALSLTSAGLTGAGAGDYTLGLNTCNGGSIAAGDFCVVDVNFTPQSAGLKSAAVTVATELGPQVIGLTGSGVALPVAPPVVAVTPVVPIVNVGSSGPKLSLTRLTTSSRVKRSVAHKKGIRLVIGVPSGAKVLRIRILRKFSGGQTKVLSDGFRSPPRAGLYRVSQNFKALRVAFGSPGNYEVQVTPGASKADLGNTKRATFKITPG